MSNNLKIISFYFQIHPQQYTRKASIYSERLHFIWYTLHGTQFTIEKSDFKWFATTDKMVFVVQIINSNSEQNFTPEKKIWTGELDATNKVVRHDTVFLRLSSEVFQNLLEVSGILSSAIFGIPRCRQPFGIFVVICNRRFLTCPDICF